MTSTREIMTSEQLYTLPLPGLLDVVECLAIDLEANLSPLDRWGPHHR